MNSSRSSFVTGALCAAALFSLLPAPLLADPDALRKREKEIESILVARLGEDAKSIRAVALDGKIVLTGLVASRVTQELAKEVVLSLDGIDRASNQIEAKDDPRLFEGQTMVEGKDAELEVEVKRALSRVSKTLAKAIEVEAVSGVVSLRGTVDGADRRDEALRTAANIAGVRAILDLLRVAS